MCEMLTAVDNSSKGQMVFAKWAGEVPMQPGHQIVFRGVLLLMTKGKQEYVIHDIKQHFQELYVLVIKGEQEYVVGLRTFDLK